ncbi:MBL fold metallo-hydrolase [Anaerosolibacter sp.]|uniref:MBL fold metallo-hydrolase n=1 Tax=Anaerosolibacter sp. TaxID=1872527 RepID=UPI0039EFD3CD
MKMIFCGGAGEVGASCIFLEIDGKRILLDSGIRMNKGKDNLPDFHLIQEAGGLDVILISHAHMDHTGSLPIISREYPEARIYMTHMTKGLVKVLLYDSLKIMNRGEEEIPIYAEKHVLDMLDRIVCYSPQFTFRPFEDKEIRITFYPAGHIAGAVMIFVEGEEGSVLYTGDISGTDQRTVNGASLPKLRPDVVVMETTYGDKLHSNREVEEKRLIDSVRETILKGGKILIPAFALGRAQEVILILKKAMSKGELPKFKLYVDGMVKDINRVYKMYPNYLKNPLAKKVFKGTEIFYDEHIMVVENNEMRNDIVSMAEPLCIVASSGMLTGGPSALYAEKLGADEKNFIAITGYQDEEAPGREILQLLEDSEKERTININGKMILLKCGIGRYGLSAHADKGELLGILHRTTPKKLFLVHGDREIIENFGKWLNGEIRTNIYAPISGEMMNFSIINQRKQLSRKEKITPLNKGEEALADDLEELWRYLYSQRGDLHAYSAEELLEIWTGKEPSSERVEYFKDTLNVSKYFTPDLRKMFLYKPVPEEELKNQENSLMEVNQMLKYVEEIFPKESYLYKKGARQEEKRAILYFSFPTMARDKYGHLMQKVEETTGWKVEMNSECNLIEAEGVLKSLLPQDVTIKKFSFFREKGCFLIELDKHVEDFDEVRQKFKGITGLDVNLKSVGAQGSGMILKPLDHKNAMEQNKAFEYIEDVFQLEPHQIYKKSKKTDADGRAYIELVFITPEVGKRYDHIIEKLQEDTGWPMVIGENPNQNEIIKVVKGLCHRYGVNLLKNPGIFTVEKMVKIKIEASITGEVKQELQESFIEETGYTLVEEGEIIGNKA